jgi:hypothetical protein
VAQQHLALPSLTAGGNLSDLVPPALGFLVGGMVAASPGKGAEMTYASVNFDDNAMHDVTAMTFFCSEPQSSSCFRDAGPVDGRRAFAYRAFRSTGCPGRTGPPEWAAAATRPESTALPPDGAARPLR